MASRVLHILGVADREGAAIARIVAMLASGLDRERYELRACFLGEGHAWCDALNQLGVPARKLPWLPPGDLPGAVRFFRGLRRAGADIVHVHYGGRSVRWLARAATGASLIAHLHSRVLETGDYRVERTAFGASETVIATSQAVADRAVAARKYVVYPAVAANSAVAARDRALTVGAACRLAPIKGLTYLLQACSAVRADFPDLRLEVAGDGPERPALEARSRELGLQHSVTFLGWRDDLAQLMPRWDVFVQPSLEEALGISILEAMAAGLPVVASRVGGIPEAVVEGATGLLVPPRDAGALAESIRILVRDGTLRRRLGAAGQERAATLFNPALMVSKVAAIYEALLAHQGTRE